ncbi:MAG: NMD3-related protein [Promethearchaeota archaeon]
MKKNPFCVVCGEKEVFYENLCLKCYSNDNPLVLEEPTSIKLEFCRDCGALSSSHRWLDANPENPYSDPILSELLHKFWKKGKVLDTTSISLDKIQIVSNPAYENPKSYIVSFRAEGGPNPTKTWESFHNCEFLIKWTLCDACIAIRNKKYKAILQIRHSSQISFEELDQYIVSITNEAISSSDRFAYISGHEFVKNGVNYFIGSDSLAHTIAAKLVVRYAAETKETQECVGWDRMKSRSRYRDVIMVRFPPFTVGDFVQVNGLEIWQVTSIGNGKIEYYNFSRKIRETTFPSEISRLRFVTLANYDSLTKFQIITLETDAVLLMHMQTYETQYYPKESLFINCREGDTILGLEIDEKLLINQLIR